MFLERPSNVLCTGSLVIESSSFPHGDTRPTASARRPAFLSSWSLMTISACGAPPLLRCVPRAALVNHIDYTHTLTPTSTSTSQLGFLAFARTVRLALARPAGLLDCSTVNHIGGSVQTHSTAIRSLIFDEKHARISVRFARKTLKWSNRTLNIPQYHKLSVIKTRGLGGRTLASALALSLGGMYLRRVSPVSAVNKPD